jgi:sporulation protein YlmC with PRC-barrel domain
MTTATTVRTVLASTAIGALIGVVPVPAQFACAANPGAPNQPSASTSSGMTDEQTVIDALAQAHAAAQRRQSRKALDEIERAEASLLNLEQLQADPRIEQTLRQLDAARVAINQKDLRTADRQLAQAAHELLVAAAAMPPGVAAGSSTPPNTSLRQQGMATSSAGIMPDQMRATQMIGDPVYDADNEQIGDIVEIVLDPAGDTPQMVIHIAGVPGADEKDVVVPISDMHADHNRMRVDQTTDQLRHAANYRLDDKRAGTGSSTPPTRRGQSDSGAGTSSSTRQ